MRQSGRTTRMIEKVLDGIGGGSIPMVIARDERHAQELRDLLAERARLRGLVPVYRRPSLPWVTIRGDQVLVISLFGLAEGAGRGVRKTGQTFIDHAAVGPILRRFVDEFTGRDSIDVEGVET